MCALHEIVVWRCRLCPQVHQSFIFRIQAFNLIWLYLFEENFSCILNCLSFILTYVGIINSLIYNIIFLAKPSSHFTYSIIIFTLGNLPLITILLISDQDRFLLIKTMAIEFLNCDNRIFPLPCS